MSGHTEVMRSAKPYEIDMAANALTEYGIPFIRRQHMGSLTTTMPLTPTPALGVSWSIEVPSVALADARRILGQLPIDVGATPAQFDFNPRHGKRNLFRFYAVVFGIAFGVLLVSKIIKVIVRLAQ